MQQQLIAGAACKLYVSGNLVGYSTGISFTRSFGIRPIYEVDSMVPAELSISGPYSVSGTINGLYTRISHGPDGTRLTNGGSLDGLIKQKYCTIEILDLKTGISLGKIIKALVTTDTWNIPVKGVMTVNCSFIGVFMQTEASS